MILSNQVQCENCNEVIFSANRHDYRTCKCGAVAVDGGMDYLRRVYTDPEAIREQSIQIPDAAYQACVEALEWARTTGRNDLGIISAIARALRDNGVKLVTSSIV